MNDNVTWDVTKEENMIGNLQLTDEVATKAINFLVSQNMINGNDLPNVGFSYGYIYKRDNGVIEALFKIIIRGGREFPVALQDNKLKVLTISQAQYDGTIKMMLDLHPCLKNTPNNETPIMAARKENNNNFLKRLNIATTNLKCLYDDNKVVLKSLDEICKRAIASFIAIQMSCDIREGKYAQSREYFFPMFDKFDVLHSFNAKELRVINNQCNEQDIIDMDWAYEALWSLYWCLGLVDDISDASKLCDCNKAMALIMDAYKNPEKKSFFKSKTPFETFRDRCRLRSVSEILNMEDLYFRYAWALNEKKVNPNTNIGNINSSNVLERRRGLEWVISNEEDWYDVYLAA